MKKDVKLYTTGISPLWFVIATDLTAWWQLLLVAVPFKFAITSLVLFLARLICGYKSTQGLYKSAIFKIFAFGLISDIIGIMIMLPNKRLMHLTFGSPLNIEGLHITIFAIIVSSVCIFVFNFFVSFKKCEMKNRIKLAIIFAIATAPYWFLLSTEVA